MISKTIKFEDFNKNAHERTYHFHMSPRELMKFDVSLEGGLDGTFQKIKDTEDHEALINLFESVVIASYGEKSADGLTFDKTDGLAQAFMQTAAYEAFFVDITAGEEAMTGFIKGVMGA